MSFTEKKEREKKKIGEKRKGRDMVYLIRNKEAN